MNAAPIVERHNGVIVVRDDLFPGGTKARFLAPLYERAEEIVYASPAEGGAQTALAQCAADMGKRATIFVAKRKEPHARARMVRRLGGQVVQITPGHLSVVQARARAYAQQVGALLLPFGGDLPEAGDAIVAAARRAGVEPAEIWCAAGSGVLMRALARAWPRAKRYAVQIGRALKPADVAGATIIVHRLPFGAASKAAGPFPADPHYDAKAWEICAARHGPGALFWNVSGPAN